MTYLPYWVLNVPLRGNCDAHQAAAESSTLTMRNQNYRTEFKGRGKGPNF